MSTKVSTDLIDLSSNTGGLVWAKGTTAQQPASATAGEMRVDTTTNTTLVYNGTQWKTLKETAFVAPPVPTHFLVVAGGGGGGSHTGGGGGAGGLRTSYGSTTGGGGSAESTTGISLNTAYTITIGAGGVGGPTNAHGNKGINSLFSTITSEGGGYGGGIGSTEGPAGDGGSGGGAGIGTPSAPSSLPGGSAQTSPVQGYNGGAGGTYASPYPGGGGGGASVIGGSATSTNGGNGGNGLSSSITGASVIYAGGGGGSGSHSGGTPGSGGTGGGGAGGDQAGGENATFNTGSGGGGGGKDSIGGTGGSGVVILRYPTADLPYFTTTGTLNTPSATDTVADVAYPVTNLAYYKLDSNANDSGLGSGYIGQGAIFNGSSSKIVTSSKILDNKTNLTISLWIKDLGNANYSGIIGEGGNSGQAGYVLAAYPDNTTLEFWRSTGNGVSYVFLGGSYNFGLGNYWTHIAITVTPSEVKYYKNGVNVKTTSITNTSTVSSAYNTNLMYDTQYNRYNSGTLDQVRIYNTTLSASNIALLYAETSATSSTLNYPTGAGGIALYEFSGNANSTSSSANNGTATDVLYAFNGTASNITYGNGRFNEAANFNGSSSQVALPKISALTDDVSVSLWVNLASTSSGSYLRMIALNGVSDDGTLTVLYNPSGGNWIVGVGNGINSSTQVLYHTYALTQSTWYHICVTRNDSTNVTKLYVNGSEKDSETVSATATIQSNATGAIGTSVPLYSGTVWNGKIDQVRIFNSALAPGDVEDLYNEHFPTKFTDGSDTALKFTGGTGDITFFDTDPNFAVDYLVVGGGGSAGVYSLGSSGGGAGGVKRTSNYGGSETPLAASIGTAYNVTVGLGGVSPTTDSKGNNGTSSLFNGVTSIGGGGGGGNGTTNFNGSDGASGGGGGPWDANQGLGGTGSNGFNGGTGNSAGSCGGAGCGGGGGGGFTSVGGNVNAATPNGGTGVEVNIIGGTGNFYAGGGAGAKLIGTNYALGGTGGSGVGGNSALASGGAGISGTVNTGSGGGGGFASTAGNGGSGVVIIRYPNTKTITVGAGLTATTAAVGTDSVTTFTAGTGTITFS